MILMRNLFLLCFLFLPQYSYASTQAVIDSSILVSTDSVVKCSSGPCRAKFKKIKKFAINGNPTAQVLIAIAYLTGDGMEQNLKSSAKWLRKAIRNGSTKAIWMLSNFYKDGVGVEKNTSKAENLLSQAVNREFGPALFQKAMQTFIPNQVNEKEIALLKRATNVGFKPATYLLAKIYETGSGVKTNHYLSAQLYTELQFSGYKDSEERLDKVKKIAKKTSPVTYKKILALDKNIEVITITNRPFNYEMYIDGVISRFKAEDSLYDGKGGMSHIRGKVCNNYTGCKGLVGPEEIRIFFDRR